MSAEPISSAVSYRRLLQASGLALLMSVSAHARAATITATSASFKDVASAVSSAHDGDVVVVPAGTASWTTTLNIAKGITLEGAGNDKTVILDDLPREERGGEGQGWRDRSREGSRDQDRRRPPAGATPESTSPQRDGRVDRSSSDQSFEQPNDSRSSPAGAAPHRASPQRGTSRGLIRVEIKPTQFFRLTGITFRAGSVAIRPQNGGCVIINGTAPAIRVDHCHFDQLYQTGIVVTGWIYGVVDHNVWDIRAASGTIYSVAVYNGKNWGGGANDYGDGSWAAATNFGSNKFLFVENNTITNLGTIPTAGIIDCDDGGRYVSRFNTFKNCSMISGHGTETGGRHRGQRAIEFYNNTDTADVQAGIGITRSGTILYHHNSWNGPVTPRIPLVVFRETWPYRWGAANGANSWDVNDTEGNGTNVPGHKPHLYASGKHTGANGSSGTLISAGANWQPNQWKGYMLTNTSQATRMGSHPTSRIESNTSDTITYNTLTPDGQPKTFNTGDNFEIYKVLVALDQPGRGKCDLLAGNPATNTVTGNASWPHQALEPIYSWNNTVNREPARVESNYATLSENRDYYNETPSFDGTVGVGVGPVGSRPRNCTPGVGYWATDEGEWDSTHAGPDGQLYVCSSPNTWSLYYKPYTYPHPLVKGPPPQTENKAVREVMGE